MTDDDILVERGPRINLAIHAAADALLAVCALETGLDPLRARHRANKALKDVYEQARREAQE